MRVAVLSDIHGNLEALEAVLEDLQRANAERVVCLGDLIGYGPDPDAVVSRIRELGYGAILGNHEAALAVRWEREQMNFQARANNISTEALLSADNLRYCRQLPRTLTIEGALFVHGSPPDSVSTYLYMLADAEVERIFRNDSRQLFFVGHTHELKLVRMEGGRVARERLGEGWQLLARDRKYLINCGSVGQPRDGDPRSKYVIWDSEMWSLEVRVVNYDAGPTIEKILRRGFSRSYADRLR